jgi:hypothetical protein
MATVQLSLSPPVVVVDSVVEPVVVKSKPVVELPDSLVGSPTVVESDSVVADVSEEVPVAVPLVAVSPPVVPLVEFPAVVPRPLSSLSAEQAAKGAERRAPIAKDIHPKRALDMSPG